MNRLFAVLLFVATLTLGLPAEAKPWWVQGNATSGDQDFLAPDVAFRVTADVDGDLLHVRWVIADGYYLYRQRMRILAESPDLTLGVAQWPRGVQLTDPYMGAQEVYFQQVEATVPLKRGDYGAHPVQVKVEYQGCAKDRLCYPTIAKVLFPNGPAASSAPASNPPLRWQLVAIFGGCGAFLLAGLRLRKT
jgi:thiol:disulfide interchange protein DsbD